MNININQQTEACRNNVIQKYFRHHISYLEIHDKFLFL